MISRRHAVAALAAVPATALAQNHGGHTMRMPAPASSAPATPATQAFRAAAATMHAAMDIPLSGDVDVDFVRGMIAHHEGAVAMAKVVLTYGSDERIKALARDIVAAQEKEIAFMRDYLKSKGRS